MTTTCRTCGREIEPFGDGEWKDAGTTDAARIVRCYDDADTIPTDVPSDQRHEPEPEPEHLTAARHALALSDETLSGALALAACPSSEMTDAMRSALMIEASARLGRTATDSRLWLGRYELAQAHGG